jgi:UDP-glucose 4-epimerase
MLAFEALGERDRLIYNIGNGQGFSIREVIESARRVTGHPIPVDEAERRPGDPAVLIASSEKIERELGWKREFDQLDAIVLSAWKWHQLRYTVTG